MLSFSLLQGNEGVALGPTAPILCPLKIPISNSRVLRRLTKETSQPAALVTTLATCSVACLPLTSKAGSSASLSVSAAS